MSKKIRLLALLFCAVLFFIITPYMILYSLGYRVDFAKLKIVPTGGIYVRANPYQTNISIDSKINQQTGIFSNSIFVQNLLPGNHTVSIKKNNYYDYYKNLPVQRKEVTKLENVVLIKKDINFNLLESGAIYFSISPNGKNLLVQMTGKKPAIEIINLDNNQKQIYPATIGKITSLIWAQDSSKVIINTSNNYYLLNLSDKTLALTPPSYLYGATQIYFNPNDTTEIFFIKNKNVFSNNHPPTGGLPLIKGAASYLASNNSIEWLSYDGILYNYSISDKKSQQVQSPKFNIKTDSSYKIISGDPLVIKEDNGLFILNKNGIFENLYNNVLDSKISPDGQKLLYYNNHEIFYYLLSGVTPNKIFLNKFTDNINNCYWLNSDYLIFDNGNKITISEIDNRGNINIVDLPQKLNLTDKTTVNLDNPKIYFNLQDKKLYILTGGQMLQSEVFIP